MLHAVIIGLVAHFMGKKHPAFTVKIKRDVIIVSDAVSPVIILNL